MAENIDFVSNGSGTGDVAKRLLSLGRNGIGMLRPVYDPETMTAYSTIYVGGDRSKEESYKAIQVNAATLQKDEWMQLDTAVMKVAQSRLNGIQDLIDRGLVFNLGNALGTTVFETQDMSDAMEAELSMDGKRRSRNDRVQYSSNYLPLPIIHVDYEINARVLAASRSLGNPVDVSQAEMAARRVAEKLEAMLFTSTTYSFGGGTIYSYLNHPDRNQVPLDTAWDDSTVSAADIIADVMKMKQKAIEDKHYGPYMLYVPTSYETILDEDYSTSGQSTQTIRERILKIANITGIKIIDTLTDNNVLLVQMTSDVVRLVKGLPIQNIEWNAGDMMSSNFKVMTIQVPQIRSDYNKTSGIVHMA